MAQTVELNDDGTRREKAAPVEVRENRRGFDPMIGRRLMHYEIVEVLGQGGMSVVYRGRDTHLSRDVAVKVLHPFLAGKSECRQRLAREARAVARLEHANILKIFDFSGDPPTWDGKSPDEVERDGFLVCELVEGDTLKHFADHYELREVPEVGAAVVLQLCRALAHAHDQGVVHRDLKPENVMVRQDGALKLMDFGIAHVVDQKALTVTGTLLGSPAHMAPECIEGDTADERSDLFSLGTCLYWLCTGHLPFEATSPHALLKAIVEAKCHPPQQLWPRVSDELARVLTRAMARLPEDRFQDAAEMAIALEEVLDAAGLDASEPGLRALLADPREGLASASAQVRARYLARAEDFLDEGAKARAFGALNRILGERPHDEDAQKLIARAHDLEGDLEEDDEETVEDEVEALPPTPPPVLEERAGGYGRFLVLGLVFLAVGAAVAIANVVDAEERPANDALTSSDINEGAGFEIRTKKVPDDVGPKVVETKGSKPKADVREAEVRVAAIRTLPPIEVKATGAARSLEVFVRPYAEIFVDDKPVAKHAIRATVNLKPGSHKLRFENPLASTKELVVRLDGGKLALTEGKAVLRSEGEVSALRVVLKAKPALLSVEATPSDAVVSVRGQPRGKASSSITTPLIVTFPERVGEEEVPITVFKPGYKVWTKKRWMRGGATTKIKVVLEPESDVDPKKAQKLPGDRPIVPTQ